MQTINHGRGELAFTWNQQTGHLDEVASPSGVVTRYVADGPLLESVEWRRLNQKVGSVSYDYEDGRFRRDTVTVAGGQGAMAVDYRYDGDGLIEYAGDMSIIRDEQTGRAERHHLGSTGVKMSYETTYGELTSIETETSLTPPRLTINYATRDALGRITSKAETYLITRNDEDETKTFEYEYGYDSRGRLATVKVREDGDEQWTREITYGYDGNGNRTQVVTVTAEGTTTQTAKYAADDRLLCMSDGTTLTRFEYTGNGSLETKVAITTEDSCDTVPAPGCYESCETTTYDYDAMGNLLSVVLPDETIIAYDVDAAGRRIAKRVNGTLVKRWLWDGQLRPIAELAPNGSISSLFVYADGVNSPDYMIREGVAYTFVKDHLGSVRMVLNSENGGIVQAVSYDAWGVPEVVAGGLDYQPFGFAGGLYDSHTKATTFGVRDYLGSTGTWLAKDPIGHDGGDLNLYRYAGGDPINHIDPNGMRLIPDAASASSLARIAANAHLQSMIEALDGASLDIYIEEVPVDVGNLESFGGARTMNNYKSELGVLYNINYLTYAADACGLPPMSRDQAIAHELGHLYGMLFGDPSTHNMTAIGFENVLRRGPGRTDHQCFACYVQ